MVPLLLLYGIFLEPSLSRYLPFFAFCRQASGLWRSCSFILESSVFDLLMAPAALSSRSQLKCHLYKLDGHLKQSLITSTPSASISSWPVFFCFLIIVQCLHPQWSVSSQRAGPLLSLPFPEDGECLVLRRALVHVYWMTGCWVLPSRMQGPLHFRDLDCLFSLPDCPLVSSLLGESPTQASRLCLRYSLLHSLSHVPKEEFRSPSLLGLNQEGIDFWWVTCLSVSLAAFWLSHEAQCQKLEGLQKEMSWIMNLPLFQGEGLSPGNSSISSHQRDRATHRSRLTSFLISIALF